MVKIDEPFIIKDCVPGDADLITVDETYKHLDRTSGEPMCFIVNQSPDLYAFERKNGCLFADVKSENGRFHDDWIILSDMRPGDVIFHYSGQSIVAVSVVVEESTYKRRLDNDDNLKAFLYYVKCDYKHLLYPFSLRERRDEIAAFADEVKHFTKAGKAHQIYCSLSSKGLSKKIWDLISLANDSIKNDSRFDFIYK